MQARFLSWMLLEIRNGCYQLQFAKKMRTKIYFQLKLKRIHVVGKGSWKKEKLECLKLEFPFTLDSINRCWKVFNGVLSNQKLSNLASNFPTSFFPISFRTFQLKSFQLLVFPTTLSYYTYSENCLANNFRTENFPITRYFQLNFLTSNL